MILINLSKEKKQNNRQNKDFNGKIMKEKMIYG